jgi:hypothetical protein
VLELECAVWLTTPRVCFSQLLHLVSAARCKSRAPFLCLFLPLIAASWLLSIIGAEARSCRVLLLLAYAVSATYVGGWKQRLWPLWGRALVPVSFAYITESNTPWADTHAVVSFVHCVGPKDGYKHG